MNPTTIQDRQLKTHTGITVPLAFFFPFFVRKQGVLFKMLWMSLAYFMFLLPYNKVLL